MGMIAGTEWATDDARAYIEDRVHKIPFSGCWLWDGALTTVGYGRVRVRRKPRRNFGAHRLAYEAFVGPIPTKALVCHKCDVRACCNPDHLFLGTPAENSADMVAKSRQGRRCENANPGEKHGMSKLTEAQVRDIRARYAAGGILQRELAAEFGVRQTAISRVVRGKRWSHV